MTRRIAARAWELLVGTVLAGCSAVANGAFIRRLRRLLLPAGEEFLSRRGTARDPQVSARAVAVARGGINASIPFGVLRDLVIVLAALDRPIRSETSAFAGRPRP